MGDGTIRFKDGGTVSVLEVRPGSVVVFKDVALSDDDADEAQRAADHHEAVNQLATALGHEAFALVTIEGDGRVECWGPDADLKAKVDGLLGRV